MKTKLLSLALVSALAIIGCKKQEQSAPTENDTQAAQVAPNCDDASVKNSLIKTIANQLSSEVNKAVSNYADADELDLGRRTLQRLGELGLDLQNAQADGASCQAYLVINIPVVDSTYAEQYYKDNGLTSLDKRLANATLSLSNGQITAPLRYSVDNSTATLDNAAIALAAIADMMSASAYQMAQSESRIDLKPKPIVVQPLEPTRIESAQPLPQIEEPSEPTQFTTPVAPEEPKAPAATETKTNNNAPVEGDGEITIVETDETY